MYVGLVLLRLTGCLDLARRALRHDRLLGRKQGFLFLQLTEILLQPQHLITHSFDFDPLFLNRSIRLDAGFLLLVFCLFFTRVLSHCRLRTREIRC